MAGELRVPTDLFNKCVCLWTVFFQPFTVCRGSVCLSICLTEVNIMVWDLSVHLRCLSKKKYLSLQCVACLSACLSTCLFLGLLIDMFAGSLSVSPCVVYMFLWRTVWMYAYRSVNQSVYMRSVTPSVCQQSVTPPSIWLQSVTLSVCLQSVRLFACGQWLHLFASGQWLCLHVVSGAVCLLVYCLLVYLFPFSLLCY